MSQLTSPNTEYIENIEVRGFGGSLRLCIFVRILKILEKILKNFPQPSHRKGRKVVGSLS